jgi:hypothetical protein
MIRSVMISRHSRLVLRRQACLEVPRQQRFQRLDRGGRGQVFEHEAHVREWLDVIGAGRHDPRVQIRAGGGTDLAVTEDPGRDHDYLRFFRWTNHFITVASGHTFRRHGR